MKKKITIVYLSFVLFIFFNSCTSTTSDEQTFREFVFEEYADTGEQVVATTLEEAENLVAYANLKDSTLYVINEEQFKTVLSDNLWPALKYTSGESNARFTDFRGATIPLAVISVSASTMIMAAASIGSTKFPRWDLRRKVEKKESFISTCFDMRTVLPHGPTMYDHFHLIAHNIAPHDASGMADPPLNSGTESNISGRVAQIEHEIFTEPDPEGEIGAETVLQVQKYYGYSSENCTTGFNEHNVIKTAWVKNITGHWPNP